MDYLAPKPFARNRMLSLLRVLERQYKRDASDHDQSVYHFLFNTGKGVIFFNALTIDEALM